MTLANDKNEKLANLTDEECEAIRRTLLATFHYRDFDFHTRLGVTETEMKQILETWPRIDDSDEASLVRLAIHNSLNDLLRGEGISDAAALKHIGVDRDEMFRVWQKWANRTRETLGELR